MEKTMDPLMRKLFQPREAREKLRGMGGIMSSSPQLASTVAKFQQGGPIQSRSLGMPSAPDAPLPSAGRARATRVGDRTYVLTDDGRVLDAQTGAPAPQEVAAEVLRKLNPQLSMADIVGAAPDFTGGVNPSFTEDRPDRFVGISDLAPMSEPAMPADPRAPFDMAAFQRDLTGAGRAVAGPGLMAIDELSYDGPFFAPANDTSAAEAAIDRRMNADAAVDAPADARAAPQSVSDVTRALEEFYPGSGYADVMRGGPRMPPDLSDKSGGDFTNFITDSLGNAAQLGTMLFPGARLPASEIIEAAPEIQDRDAQRAEIEAQLADQNLSEFEREALEARLLGLSGEGFIADAGSMVIDSLGRIISAPGRIAGAGLSAIGATDAGAALLEAYDAGYYDSESPRYRNASQPADSGAPAPAETPEDEARRMLLRQDRRAATPVDEADADPVADPETTPDDNQDAPLENLDPNDPDTFDTTYDKMLTRLQSVMGTKDEDSRQKAMANLAMIGLAIAAGQSPDALTNIAQGALTGVKAIREDQAADKEQDKALRMAALNAALEMEQGTRSIEATAARDDLKFDRDVVLAGLRGDSGRNPRAIEDFVQNVYTEALKAASGVARPDDMVEGETPEAYAARKANTARQYMGQQFPGTYGGGVPAADDLTEDERQLLGGA
jgi:hypothetical protein